MLLELVCSRCGRRFQREESPGRHLKRRNFCRRDCYYQQIAEERRGAGGPSWKGGRITGKDGYVSVRSPGHPRGRGRTEYVYEHRLVMEQHLGRYLKAHERIHHINHVKDDNRIENLMLMTQSEHGRLHAIKQHALRADNPGDAKNPGP